MHSGLQADPVHHKIMWSPFVRLDTWVRAAVETPLSIWDPMPLLSAGTAAFLSRELSRARCFPFQMVVAWGSGALCFTKLFPLHAKWKFFGEISRSECSPASLCFRWDGRKVAPCLCCDEHFEKLVWVCRAQALEEHDLMLLPLLMSFLSFSFFQGHNNLECRITPIQVDLWWIPWLWLSTSSPIPHKETQFTHPHPPTATHHLPLMSRWWNPPREDSLAFWPDCVRRRCHCKMTEMEGIRPFEHLLVLQVLSPSLPCAFPH